MSQQVKEFIKRSGVDVQSPDSNSNNDNFARELESDMFRRERLRPPPFREPVRPELRQRRPLQRKGTFAQFENNSPLENEFSDLNMNKIVNNVMEAENFGNIDEFTMPEINESIFANNDPDLEISPFRPGMFNAGVDSGYGQKDVVLELKDVMRRRPLAKTQIAEGLYIETTEMLGRYGTQKVASSHTRNLGLKGNMSIPLVTVQFKIIIYNERGESQKVSVNIYKNGKIRFSGGFLVSHMSRQPELIRRYVVENYTNGQPFFSGPIQFNNLSGQFNINGTIDLKRLQFKFARYGSVNYNPELSPMMYVNMNGYTLNLTRTGNVQIIGAKNPAVLENTYRSTANLIRDFYRSGDSGIFLGKMKAPKKAKVKKTVKPKTVNTKIKRVYKKRKLTANQMKAVKVTGKICERMKRSEIVDLAKNFGIVNFRVRGENGTRNATRKEICNMIKKKTNVQTFRNTNKNKNSSLSGKGDTFRINKTLCNNMSKKEIQRIAKILKIQFDTKDTKPVLCKKIEMYRKVKTPEPKPKPKPTKRQVQRNKINKRASNLREKTIKKRGLNNNSIRKELEKEYGSKWIKRYKPNLNKDVQNVKRAMNGLRPNKSTGIPFKGDVKQLEKRMVNRWKFERRNALEKKYLMNKVNATGIPLNMKSSFKNAASNYIMNHVRNFKREPSQKKMDDYRKNWLKRRNNLNTNGRPRGINRTVRARVEKI